MYKEKMNFDDLLEDNSIGNDNGVHMPLDIDFDSEYIPLNAGGLQYLNSNIAYSSELVGWVNFFFF